MHRPPRRRTPPRADREAARRRARDRSLRRDVGVAVLALLVLAVLSEVAGPDREDWWFVPVVVVGAGTVLSALVRISIALLTGGPPSAFRR